MKYIKVSETVYNDDGTVTKLIRELPEEEFESYFPVDIDSLKEGDVVEDLDDRYVTVVEVWED